MAPPDFSAFRIADSTRSFRLAFFACALYLLACTSPYTLAQATGKPQAQPDSGVASYAYPFTNPLVATIAGTPEPFLGDVPQRPKLRTLKLPVRTDKKIPRAFWYGRRLEYSFAAQNKPAPLIFSIAGTGAYHNSTTNSNLLRVLYGMGFHVVGISSPTHPKFVIAASGTGVPGHVELDARDLYRVMQEIVARHDKRVDVTGYHLTGYSLGGMNAAFVAKLDDEERVFDFQRVLLINPPVSLYNSISKLDRMLDNIPGGIDNFNHFFSRIVMRIGDAYTRSTTVEFNQDLVYDAFKDNPPTNEQLAAVIGIAFRLAAANMIFTADSMADFGFIKPKGVDLAPDHSMTDYLQVSLRLGFTDYFHEFFMPFYSERIGIRDRLAFAHTQSLHAIADYLASNRNIGVVHNLDDVILAPGEIDFFVNTFGDRARVFPHGGHLGNVFQKQTLSTIKAFFAGGAGNEGGSALK